MKGSARTFMYLCIGFLALLAAHQLGVQTAQGQGEGELAIGVARGDGGTILLAFANGNVWSYSTRDAAWTLVGNPLGDVPAQETSWSTVKGKFSK
jgi:hypothetical protein